MSCPICWEKLSSHGPVEWGHEEIPLQNKRLRRSRYSSAKAKRVTVAIAKSPSQFDVVATSCGHVFHHTCLLQWVLNLKSGNGTMGKNEPELPKRKCPVCNGPCDNVKQLQKVFLPVDEVSEGDPITIVIAKELDETRKKLKFAMDEHEKYHMKEQEGLTPIEIRTAKRQYMDFYAITKESLVMPTKQQPVIQSSNSSGFCVVV